MTAKYDYVAKVRLAYRSNPVFDAAARKVLRKLVREAAIIAAQQSKVSDETLGELGDRIARELVPGKRGAK